MFGWMLTALDVGYQIEPEDLDQIPRSGPVVAVANHPFGTVERAILAALLPQIRPARLSAAC